MTMAYFLEGKNDLEKSKVFNHSRHHWVLIEDDAKSWVLLNWAKWEGKQPEWFTEGWKALVPVEFIPITGDARRRESVRRASVVAEIEGDLGGGLGGAIRASIRRASIGSGYAEDSARVVPVAEESQQGE